jgi:hypothetical protein
VQAIIGLSKYLENLEVYGACFFLLGLILLDESERKKLPSVFLIEQKLPSVAFCHVLFSYYCIPVNEKS